MSSAAVATSRFERRPEIDERVKNILALFDGLDRGDTVLWREIEKATGFNKRHQKTKYALDRARKQLRDGPRGLVLHANGRDGFLILTPSQQVTLVPKVRDKRILGQCNRKFKEVGATPDEGLSDHERRKKNFEMESADDVRLSVLRKRREAETILKPTETLPKRPRDA